MSLMRGVPLNINAETAGIYANKDWNNINIGLDPTRATNENMMLDDVLDTGIVPGSGLLCVSIASEATELFKLAGGAAVPLTADATFSTTQI